MIGAVAQLTDVQVRRPDFEVADVSLSILRGRVVGLVGPNGAGKTTIIRALLGLIASDRGIIEVFGLPAGSPAALARIGVVLDQPTASPEWRVTGIGRRLRPFYENWDEDLFGVLLDRFDVPSSRRVGELSRGQGVKLSLATAMAQRPELLILDEPSSGLDPASRREVSDAIAEFMRDPGHAALFSTHITTDLDDLADDLIIVIGGRIARHGRLPDIRAQFAMARGTGSRPADGLIGPRNTDAEWRALIRASDTGTFGADVAIDTASIDDIIIHLAVDHERTAS